MKRWEIWSVGLLAFMFILFGPKARAETAVDLVVTPRNGAPVRLHSVERGHGPPIVLLHGLGGSSYAFRNLSAALAPTHRMISLDLKGFGRSEKPLDTLYGPADQAELVIAFLRARHLNKVTLVGHSFGGAVALLTALMLERAEPTRITRLALFNAPAYAQELPRLQRLMTMPVLPYVLLALTPAILNTRAALQTSRPTATQPSDDDAAAYAHALYETGGRHALIASSRALAESDTRALEPHYRSIRQPTLLVWCRHDDTVPLANGVRLVRALPRARLEVLDQCSHMPHEEQPAETLAVLSAFLRGK